MSAARDPARALATVVSRAAGRPAALRTLLLDLDGTLAPIAPTPGRAVVPAGAREALVRLIGAGWTVAVVSGRPRAQVRAMVPVPGMRAFGSHGLEGSWDGRSPARPGRAVRDRLRALGRSAAALARRFPGAYFEGKPAGIALHDRNVATDRLQRWRRQVGALLRDSDLEGLQVLRGRRVIEVRPCGVHKGTVVRGLLAGGVRRGRDASLVAAGDDRTDEDMFREVRPIGLPVRVGRPGVKTLATRRLPSPRAVARFLRLLADVSTAAGPAPRGSRKK